MSSRYILVPVYFKKDKPEEMEIYEGLRNCAFQEKGTSMSDVMKAGTRKELKKMKYL